MRNKVTPITKNTKDKIIDVTISDDINRILNLVCKYSIFNHKISFNFLISFNPTTM